MNKLFSLIVSEWQILLLIVFIFIVISALSWFLVFDIYEVRYSVTHGPERSVLIEAIPLSYSGARVPFRKVYCKYFIDDTENACNIISENNNNGILIIELLGKTGVLEIEAKPVYSLWTNKIKIPLNNPEEL